MGVSAKDATRSAEDVISTPAPGETLAMFYARSRTSHLDVLSSTKTDMDTGEYWAQKAHQEHANDNRGKQLRRDGFGLAEARYGESPRGHWWSFDVHAHITRLAEYKPILDEVERILAEAGLDEEEMRMQGARATHGDSAGAGQSRNRR